MKYACTGLALLIGSISCYAVASCDSPNPYARQSCEQLNQSGNTAKAAEQQQLEQQFNQYKKIEQQKIDEANKPPELPKPTVPAWQQSLAPPPPPQQNQTTSQETSATTPPPIAPVPTLEPTTFSAPKAVTLPGGVNVIPTTPEKKKGAIKYY